MHFDKNLAQLFILNFNEAYRSAKMLILSYDRVKPLIPLHTKDITTLNADNLDKLDAFRVRYCDLQDNLGNKVFRTLLNLEEEQPGSNLDILNKMEKRGILNSFLDWKELREVRNLFAHDYPETDEEKADVLNVAFWHIPKLIKTVNNIITYMQNKLKFGMDEFPLLKELESDEIDESAN